jgi:16S rRNA (guanine966-N2)-methyltransferase
LAAAEAASAGFFLNRLNIGSSMPENARMVPPASRSSAKPARHAAAGTVRIIGGRLRGSKLPVADLDGLRPSSDRVRETLFNWLQHDLHGARVLDLFAGSGALGIEAVSRGAQLAVLLERAPTACVALRQSVQRLGIAAHIELRCADALSPAALQADERFDGAFIDPPFAAGLWQAAVDRVLPQLAPRAWLYLESAADAAVLLPADWQLHREGRTREVRYALYRRATPAP